MYVLKAEQNHVGKDLAHETLGSDHAIWKSINRVIGMGWNIQALGDTAN